MKAELGLPSVKGDDEHGGGMTGGFGGSMGGVGQGGKSKRPISVKFEIPYFTTSGIQVRYLKIIEPKVRAVAFSLLLASLLLAILGVPGRSVGIGRAKLVRAIMRFCSGLAFLLLGICFRAPRITLGKRSGCRNGAMARRSILPVSWILVSICWRLFADHLAHQLQYPSLPWVRYITQSGDIAVRLPDVQ